MWLLAISTPAVTYCKLGTCEMLFYTAVEAPFLGAVAFSPPSAASQKALPHMTDAFCHIERSTWSRTGAGAHVWQKSDCCDGVCIRFVWNAVTWLSEDKDTFQWEIDLLISWFLTKPTTEKKNTFLLLRPLPIKWDNSFEVNTNPHNGLLF